MKNLAIIFVLFAFSGMAFSKQVDHHSAKKTGQAFLSGKTLRSKGSYDLQLVYSATYGSKSSKFTRSDTLSPACFYVFNSPGSKGFVIVAGDDNATPILAYSDEINFDPDNIPPNAARWIEDYRSQMQYIIEHKTGTTEKIKNEWKKLQTSQPTAKSSAAAGPLIQTKWGQSPYFNELCPVDPETGEKTVAGCVATSMAQIMKFWNYPANGAGFHSYAHPKYGTISANFGSTIYQWTSMTNTVTDNNAAIAALVYHCGVSIDMNYNISSRGGSSAYTFDVAAALKTYFGYASSIQGIYRSSYSDDQWKSLLKTELNAGRPVQYAGNDYDAGHAFVCDGYDANDLFHFNWGWSGNFDAYFSIDMLNPYTYKFNSGHRAVIGIQPPSVPQIFDMRLNKNVSLSAATLDYNMPFTITTNIANYGADRFNGDICAAIFDNSDIFIAFAGIKTGISLNGKSSYTDDLVFSNNGLTGMFPGKYRIGIFYRPAGGNWMQLSDNGNFTNNIPLSVVSRNDIEINSLMTIAPGTLLTGGQPVKINLDLVNKGLSTFKGQYKLDLYYPDGTFAQTISILDEKGLPSNIVSSLSFSTPVITADPGTYLLTIHHKSVSGDWQLTGSSVYLNPVKVIVRKAFLQADAYEENNSFGKPYDLPVGFSGNSTEISTSGANFHTASDYDYYKVTLPAGYAYSVTPRLFDSQNGLNGNTFTLDAVFYYSVNGGIWSAAFSDAMSEDIIVSNGGAVDFLVTPLYSGASGTYMLDIDITRNIVTAVEKKEFQESIKIYPNPAFDFIKIDLQGSDKKINEIQIINISGQPVISFTSREDGLVTIPVSHLSNGAYFLRLKTDDGVMTRKFIVRK